MKGFKQSGGEKKMKKVKILIALVLAFGLITACTHSSGTFVLSSPSPVLDRIMQRDELVVGTAASMPPFNMTTKSGKIIGLDIDLARYMADSLGVRLKLKPMPFAELLPALESGNVDMILSSMTITLKRNSKVAFVGPYYISGKGVLTNIETLSSITDPNEFDQRKYKIAALEGSTSQEFVENIMPKAILVKTKDYDEGVKKLLDKEVDAMLADYPICVVSVLRYPDQELFSIVSPFTYEPIGVALPAHDPLLVNLVDNFLNTLKGSGALDNLIKYWFEGSHWWDQLP